jgi:hypothetical protein
LKLGRSFLKPKASLIFLEAQHVLSFRIFPVLITFRGSCFVYRCFSALQVAVPWRSHPVEVDLVDLELICLLEVSSH